MVEQIETFYNTTHLSVKYIYLNIYLKNLTDKKLTASSLDNIGNERIDFKHINTFRVFKFSI